MSEFCRSAVYNHIYADNTQPILSVHTDEDWSRQKSEHLQVNKRVYDRKPPETEKIVFLPISWNKEQFASLKVNSDVPISTASHTKNLIIHIAGTSRFKMFEICFYYPRRLDQLKHIIS